MFGPGQEKISSIHSEPVRNSTVYLPFQADRFSSARVGNMLAVP